MINFQICRNTTDAIPLYLPQRLYLKPSARFNISLQLPNMRKLEKSVSHWEIMEQLRTLIRPDEFSLLKVSKTTPEFIRFDGELDNRTRLERVLMKLDNQTIKLKDIQQLIRLKAGEYKVDYPTRQKWDSFFQDTRDMDEMKPGQRPDTIHLSNLPRKWFVPYPIDDNDDDDDDNGDNDDILPSEKVFFRIFEKFGPIRYVDIPICDPYRKKMKEQISGIRQHAIDDKVYFEGYVQFKDYSSFLKTIDTFKGMKLMRKNDEQVFCVNIKVDFDRLKHLSDASIKRREIVRERLVRRQKDKEEKEQKELEDQRQQEQNDRQRQIDEKAEKERRRKEREEKRKRRILEKLKINECDDINDKIAREEKKLLKAQRKLEAIRLVEELFRRIKDKKEELNLNKQTKCTSANELKQFKEMSEIKLMKQRQKLQSAIEGRVVLKSILTGRRQRSKSSSTTDSSISSEKNGKQQQPNVEILPPDLLYNPNWYNYHPYPPIYPPPIRGVYHNGPRFNLPGPSRGRSFGRNRNFGRRYRYYRNNNRYPPDVEKEYVKYFSKFVPEHDDRRSRTRSRSRNRYSSRSKRRSYTRSRSRTRSYSSRSYSSSRSRSSSRSKSNRSSQRRRRSKSKSRSKSIEKKK